MYLPGRLRKDDNPDKEPTPPRDLDVEKLQKAYADLEDTHRQTKEAYIEMLLNLAIAAEYKDPDTGNHILRISDYSTEMARTLGCSEEQIEAIRFGSPMHDIGKLGIPDRILQKPGKLTPAEWQVMQQHTVIGARMFHSSKSPILKASAEIALTHHEKFDGSGYPNSLKGRGIPLFGRIVAVADVFDAVVSKRSYKEAWSFEEGTAYLRSLAGTHLDPELIDLFFKIEGRIRSIYEANRDIQQFIREAGREADFQLGGS